MNGTLLMSHVISAISRIAADETGALRREIVEAPTRKRHHGALWLSGPPRPPVWAWLRDPLLWSTSHLAPRRRMALTG